MSPEEPIVPVSVHFRTNDADVVVRAAGTLDFYVHKCILSLASPIFKDMFTIPQPPSTTPNTLPLVDVQESAKTWENILRIVYHRPNPTIGCLDDLQSLLLAAKKYEMKFIINAHKKVFERRAFIRQDPLRLYAIACVCGIDDQAKYVARTADLLTVVGTTENEGLALLTSTFHHRLITFLFARDNELLPILEESWTSFTSCCKCTPGDYHGEDVYERTKEKLKMSDIRMEEVYLAALEDRSTYYRKACSSNKCSVMATEIKRFLERMFQERERVCDKFMW